MAKKGMDKPWMREDGNGKEYRAKGDKDGMSKAWMGEDGKVWEKKVGDWMGEDWMVRYGKRWYGMGKDWMGEDSMGKDGVSKLRVPSTLSSIPSLSTTTLIRTKLS